MPKQRPRLADEIADELFIATALDLRYLHRRPRHCWLAKLV